MAEAHRANPNARLLVAVHEEYDVAFSGTQKCLSVPPGLAPITVSERPLARIRFAREEGAELVPGSVADRVVLGSRAGTPAHGADQYFVWAARGAPRCSRRDWRRPSRGMAYWAANLQDALIDRGVELLVEERYRLPQLMAPRVPPGVDDKWFRRALLDRYGIEIGGGLGPPAGQIWNVGLMGETCRSDGVALFLHALDEVWEAGG